MRKDKIKCLSCGKVSIDTTEVKMQDSRNGKFKNLCPFCYGTNTVNLHKDTKAKDKFIYDGEHIDARTSHIKSNKRIKKPILDNDYLSLKVLGQRKVCDVTEELKNFAPSFERTLPSAEPKHTVETKGGTYHVDHIKPFTPLELMQQKLNSQHEELKSKPNNYKLYRGWHYHRRIKKC